MVVVVLGVAMAAIGCTTDALETDDRAVQAVIRGTVRGPDGNGVAGVAATVRMIRGGGCGSLEEPGTFPPVTTSLSGEFLKVLVVPLSAPFTGCIGVQFTPPASSKLRPAIVSDHLLAFLPEGESPDTLVLSVTLRP
jgi:hypothetical protein